MARCIQKCSAKIGSFPTSRILAVPEFSTSVARFQNQITRQILLDLQRNCSKISVSEAIPPDPSPASTVPILLSETYHCVEITPTMNFKLSAEEVKAVHVKLKKTQFEIIGFSSAIVRVSGELAMTAYYISNDHLNYEQEEIIPFSFMRTVPGTYPSHSTVAGEVLITGQLLVNEYDPVLLAVTGVTNNLGMNLVIRISASPN